MTSVVILTRPLRRGVGVATLGVAPIVAGCASEAEWNTDRSLRGTRADVDTARDESWWGKPLTVDQSQIIER